jgi:hypothetical protein
MEGLLVRRAGGGRGQNKTGNLTNSFTCPKLKGITVLRKNYLFLVFLIIFITADVNVA